MTKSYLLVIVAMIVLASGSGAAVWFFRDKLMDVPPVVAPASADTQADYAAFVKTIGVDEALVRDELNDLVATATLRLTSSDDLKRGRLTKDADAKLLLELDLVKEYVGPASRNEANAFHFVAEAQQTRLRELVGTKPTAQQVVVVRRSLAKLADEFLLLRQPPTWKVDVEPVNNAEPPAMPYLDMLRLASTFKPLTSHPNLRVEPRLPAFSGADGELLAQLDQYFNSKPALAAFPKQQFPNLYHNDRILPIPMALLEYRKAIVTATTAERKILLPANNPSPKASEAVDEVYAQLERFFTAVEQFQLPTSEPSK